MLTLLVALHGNSQSSETGVTADWDVKQQMAALAVSVRELEAVVQKADPKIWEENAAPEAYVGQLRSAQASMRALTIAASELSRKPENLQAALEAYFQIERMDLLVKSLRDGIRKYQSPDLADMISRAFSRNAIHWDRLRQHIRDIAELREQEFQIANEEAQRCRANLTKQSSAQTERTRTRPEKLIPPTTLKPQLKKPQSLK
ncbi:MAG: hypothetical protein H7039_12815 [Bryobacteraceae bacterium]|nr:hypothetical protein [Bryobacteraceae bacterium]